MMHSLAILKPLARRLAPRPGRPWRQDPGGERARSSHLLADESGASLIEFALVLPILALMVMGISDVAMGFSRKLVVEAAAYRTLEKVAVRSSDTDMTTLAAEAATAAGVEEDDVTIDIWLECEREREAEVTGVCAEGEETARYVSVEIEASYTPRFDYGPLADAFGGRDGIVPTGATAAMRMQ
jgi:Flp pilus assembly protein TadG